MFVEILSFKFELVFYWIAVNLREESKMKGMTSMTVSLEEENHPMVWS